MINDRLNICFLPVLAILALFSACAISSCSCNRDEDNAIKNAYHPDRVFFHEVLKSTDIKISDTHVEISVYTGDPTVPWIQDESDEIVENFMIAQPELIDQLIKNHKDLYLIFSQSEHIKAKWRNLLQMRNAIERRSELTERFRTMAEERLDSVVSKLNTQLPIQMTSFMTLDTVTVTYSEVILHFMVDDSGRNLILAWEVLEPKAKSLIEDAEEYETMFIEMLKSRLRKDGAEEHMQKIPTEIDLALSSAASQRPICFAIKGKRTGYQESRQLIATHDLICIYEFAEHPWYTDQTDFFN